MVRKYFLHFCGAAAMALTGCGPSSPPAATSSSDLIVLLRPGPASWDPRSEERGNGVDYDLAQLFARQHSLKLKIIAADNPARALIAAHAGTATGAGGVYRPDGDTFDAGAPVIYSAAYYSVQPVVIYNSDETRPESWKDLKGEHVGVLAGSGLAEVLEKVRAAHPEVDWQLVDAASTEALISQVSDGALAYAVVASNEADAARNVYLGFETGFAVGKRCDLVWAFPSTQAYLRDDVDAFLENLRRDGTLQRMIDRYFSYSQVPRFDAGIFQDRIKTVLPAYRPLFQRVQETTGVEWRMLAAISYQESQWDAQATSETGARGLMQLTEDTAHQLGAGDRLDPDANVIAAARYFRDLKAKLPARIAEPDRTWLALASYNIGVAHLEDARVLAQKQKLNPDSWNAVKKVLPLLALPEYYTDAKYGYARGGMPVAFVDRVRAYYDILIAQQPALKPRLSTFWRLADAPERSDEPALGLR
jgi:membrane-bound lytic murein transglycosylase F